MRKVDLFLGALALGGGALVSPGTAHATLAQPPDVPKRPAAAAAQAMVTGSDGCGYLVLGWQSSCQDSSADVQALSLVQLASETQTGTSSLYVDVIEGHAYNIHFSVGAGMTGANAISSSSAGLATSTQSRREHLQQLFTDASSATVVAQYPLLRLQDTGQKRNFLALQPTFVALLDLPAAGSSGDVKTSHTDSGLELDGNLVTQEGTLAFLGSAKYSYAAGNQAFGEAIGYRPAFAYGTWVVGVRLLDAVRISVSGLFAAPAPLALDTPVTISVSLERPPGNR